MRNIKNNLIETGVLETSLILSKYQDAEILDKAAMYLPATDMDLDKRAEEIKEVLLNLKRDKVMFLTPEIAFLEKIHNDNFKEIIICLPSDYDADTYDRIAANIPNHLDVKLITDNEIDNSFFSSNAAIIAFGFADFSGDRAWILNTNYRMMERFRSFFGYKILASYGDNMSGIRPVGWAPINTYDFFNIVI